MIRAEIISPWVGNGIHDPEAEPSLTTGAHRPQVRDDYLVNRCTDTTGQKGLGINESQNPNICVVRILCSQEVFDQILSDNTYQVLWNEQE